MKIYFDMDGVLDDFDAMRPDSSELNHASKDLSEEKRQEKKQFWLDVEKNDGFWRDIPLVDNIKTLLSFAKTKGELFVLSKTPGAKHFVNGQKYVDYVANEKRKWILENMGEYFDEKHIIICDGPKGELVRPTKNDILIDDRPENIDEWISFGGRGIVFKNVNDTEQELKNIVI